MKKLVSAVAVVMSVLLLCISGFAASAESPDAYTVYKRAMKKLNEAATIRTTADYVIGDRDYSYSNLSTQVILTQTQSEGKGLQMEARMSYEGENVIRAYYKDGYYYQRIEGDSPNIKRKTKMSEQKAIAECFGLDRKLKKDNFNCAELEKTDDGYTLKYKIKGGDFKGMYANAMIAVFDKAFDELAIKTSDVTYTLDIGKDGELKSYKISFTTRYYDSSYGYYSSTELKNRVSCTVITDDQAQAIKYPENLDVYKELEL